MIEHVWTTGQQVHCWEEASQPVVSFILDGGQVFGCNFFHLVSAHYALENEPSSEETDVVRREYQARLNSDGTERPTVSSKSLLAQVESRAIAAERAALVNLRVRGEIGDDAFHFVEERLDWAEVCANRRRIP